MIALAACGLLLAGVVWMTVSIMRQSDSAVAVRVRGALARRLEGLRLSRMLARRGVAAETYLDQVASDDARDQMSACEGCAALVRCDSVLDSPAELDDFSFCPNAQVIDSLPRGCATAAANDAALDVAACGRRS